MTIKQCKIIELPKLHDDRGNLTFIEHSKHIPFAIERMYYLYDIPEDAKRGGHAHKALEQLIIAMAGSFDVILDDGQEKKSFHLNRPCIGLYVSPMIWRDLNNFSPDAVCVVLASNRYDEDDYYRDYNQFLIAQGFK